MAADDRTIGAHRAGTARLHIFFRHFSSRSGANLTADFSNVKKKSGAGFLIRTEGQDSQHPFAARGRPHFPFPIGRMGATDPSRHFLLADNRPFNFAYAVS